MYKNQPTSESDAFGGRWEEEDLLWGVSPEIEKYFTHDFKCCGIELADLHECIKHYELYHVRDERKRPLPPPPPNNSTSLAPLAAAQRRPSSGTNAAAFGLRNSGKPNSVGGNGGPLASHHHQSKRRHMFLDFEANEGAAFDNTVIREGYFPRAVASSASTSSTVNAAHHHLLRQETRERPSQFGISASAGSNSTAVAATNRIISQSRNSIGGAVCEISKPLSSTASSSPHVTVTFPSKEQLEDGISNRNADSSSPGSTLNQEGSRPYACTFPGCNRTYKNLNGLKYHATHGHLTPANDAEKPYECPVYACAKRYKNPNGLKYHMDHAHKNLEFASSTMSGNAAVKGLVSVSGVVGNKLPIE